jgi:NAD(P)-dependent dehydrogenase (short-subunit alcohol dehydrogenase family)
LTSFDRRWCLYRPLGRVGDPDDVASLVLFLAGEGARWITGQNIPVDGGITIKGGWAPLAP